MAKLVAAFGSSHSPALASPAEDMAGHARRDEMYAHHLDREGNRVSYAELLRKAPAGIDLSPVTLKAKISACERHLDRLAASIAAAVHTVKAMVGEQGLAGLVNNAGIAVGGPIEALPVTEWRRQFEVNVFGLVGVTQAFLPLLRQGQGRIINIGSMSGRGQALPPHL